MSKHTDGYLAEIERIKSEYYCGTRKAVEVHEKRQKCEDFAREVNGTLGTNFSWRYLWAAQRTVFRKRFWNGEGGKLLADTFIQYMTDHGLTHVDYESIENDAAHCNELSLIDDVRITPQFSELHEVLARPSGAPLYMNLGCDSLYFRMRDEGILHNTELQRVYLARICAQNNLDTIQRLARFLDITIDESKPCISFEEQTGDSIDVTDYLASTLEIKAATYAQELLKRSDLRGWLRNFLER